MARQPCVPNKLGLAFVALAVLWAAIPGRPEAQERAPEETQGTLPFQPGEFLTEADFEHLESALGFLNLKPQDLNFEKKVIQQRFVLPLCARALDEPLRLPEIAQATARELHPRMGPGRQLVASRVLGLGDRRWSPDELRLDAGELGKLYASLGRAYFDWKGLSHRPRPEGFEDTPEGRRKKRAYDEALQAIEDHRVRSSHGGRVIELQRPADRNLPVIHEKRPLSHFDGAFAALARREKAISREQASLLATRLPNEFFEAPAGLATSEATSSDLIGAGVESLDAGVLLAAAMAWSALEGLAAAQSARAGHLDPQSCLGEPSKLEGVTGGVIAAWETGFGFVVVGGTGPNTYAGDNFALIIDLGGDDVYRGRVACGVGLPGFSPISIVLDLAGNDQYLGQDFTQGFGMLGVGILWDLGSGNDLYKARFCAQGCGLCGYGELHDDGGDDLYQGDSGVQGAAALGYGHLIDLKGNDVYRACRYSQAFAQVKGVGVLTDGTGNDLYYAGGKYLHQPLWNDRYQSLSQGFSIGNRASDPSGTGGGVALLLDEGDGNDTYIADIYGQGSSYWFSLGMLIDRGGNDNYVLTQYGQGAGIHLSSGILVDLSGNDHYTNPFGVGTGGAHDYAVGWLIDRAGNDLYQGNGQGQGLNFAVGILLDVAGDDSHCSNNEGYGGKGTNNSVSLLLDLGGDDNHGRGGVKNNCVNRGPALDLVYDMPAGSFPGCDFATLPTKQNPPPLKVRVQHILVSFDGCRVPLKNAEKRSEKEAEALARKLLREARTAGADWAALQKRHNEDSGTDDDNVHATYECEADTRFIPEFKEMAMSLGVGQIGLSRKGRYGWHIIKRIE